MLFTQNRRLACFFYMDIYPFIPLSSYIFHTYLEIESVILIRNHKKQFYFIFWLIFSNLIQINH